MPTDPFDLTGRVAVVTGASAGIGAAIATTLAAHGAEVIVTSRKPEACERVVEAIVAAGGRARARRCHIGEPESIEALYAWIRSQVGGLDILVNNAATNPSFGSVLDVEPGALDKTIEVNFRGYWLMCQHGAPLMSASGGGSIVNIASVAGERPMDGIGLYGATKAAIVNLTQAFARELGRRQVRVNAILPGLVNTRFAAALQTDPEVRARALARIPLGRIAEPDEIAGAALYFASDASRYATGAVLRVDGGLNA